MAQRRLISQHEFLNGFVDGPPALNQSLENTYASGSRNQIVQGDGFTLPWQGLAGQGDDTGTRLMRPIASTWGGLKDYFVGSIRIDGKGSMFSDIALSIWQIGSGVPSIEGLAIAPGVFASTELQVSIARNQQYSAAFTFDAGLPQPSTPDIGIISSPGFGFTGFIDGPISCKIARLRLTTGARSVASQTSAVITPAKKTVRVTFPLPSVGQDNWAVFFTQSGFGGVGLHYRAAYLLSLDVPESTVAAGIIDGIPRSLEFDFKDGDLVPEVAYIDDYPPPAGTHAVRLANVMCVLGAYGDSTAPVTASDPGTVGAISLPNFYESYKPSHLVYFPEQVVDVLARPTDEYAYVGHRNSITALQYVGVLDGPAVAVSMVWPDIGIAKPHNWCQVHGLLYLFQAKGGPVRMMPDGSPDYSFAAPVRRYMRDWTVEETIVGSHPDSLSVVYFNGREALSWSLQAQKWSPPCFFEDVCVEDHPIPSSSPSASLSPSASPSASPSSSVSASPSSSRSASASSTPSASESGSPSSSTSASPSSTPSASVSASPSASPSASSSSSPSNSGSSSPSPSSSPSASVSASPSASPSSSVSSSASASAPPDDFDETNILWRVRADEIGLGDGASLNTVVWQDMTANNRDWTFTNGVYQTNEVNGHAAVEFRGQAQNDFATGPDLSGAGLSEIDLYIVVIAHADPASGGAAYGLWTLNDANYANAHTRYPDTGGTIRMTAHLPSGQASLDVDPTPSLAAWRLLRVVAKTGASNYEMFVDGVSIASGTRTSLVFPAVTILGKGSDNGGTAMYWGLVAEWFAFSAKCGSTQLGTIHSYLNTEYGFSLP